MKPGVSIVIPTWNGLDLLKRFLPSVFAAGTEYAGRFGSPVEVVIVDDGSTDGTMQWLAAEGFDWRQGGPSDFERPFKSQVACRVVRNDSNLGFAKACNRGFEAAASPLVLLLNNDVEVDSDVIAPLVDAFAEPSVFAAHCRVFEPESGEECGTGKVGRFARGFIRVHQSYVYMSGRAVASSPSAARGERLYSIFAGGGAAMFDREKFQRIGGFENLLSPFYWEDVELSYRAWKRGFSILYEPEARASHRVSSTIGKLKRSEVRRIEQRNRLLYHWIHLHDNSMMARHIVWVILLALTAPLRLRPGFLSSLFVALKLLPDVLKRRREEKGLARRSDREVFALFRALERRPDLFVYDDYEELRRLKEEAGAK